MLEPTPLDLNSIEIVLRLLGAMVIGIIIGTEREMTHRPAGMRTHMLVALGACAIAIMSQLLYVQYHDVYGASPDPARLSAQVIAGVGFLGAGTIMREGLSVKGLTTAASLWCVACLSLAMGGGYYVLSVSGTVCMLITLTLFEGLQKKFMHYRETFYLCEVTCEKTGPALNNIYEYARKADAKIDSVKVNTQENSRTISFSITVDGRHNQTRMAQLINQLTNDELMLTVRTSDTHE